MPDKKLEYNKLLAKSLKAAKDCSKDGIVKSANLDRRDRERLMHSNCLAEIMRGWYLLTSPEASGGSTAWFGGFWAFIKHYMNERFGEDGYCLSAETSLSLLSGDTKIPEQIVIITRKSSNTTINLPHNTSILLFADKNFPTDISKYNNVNVMSLVEALCRLTPAYYTRFPQNIEIVIKMAKLSLSEVTRYLLKTQSIASAERIAGAYQVLGEISKAQQIIENMAVAGLKINPRNPFVEYTPVLQNNRITSPYSGRIQLLWKEMRETVINIMPAAEGIHGDHQRTIRIIQETYKEDAYHSLSIEGYQVTQELIEKIASGNWDPETRGEDQEQKNAMSAKGYLNAFNEVINSVKKVLTGVPSGEVLENDIQTWYRELFAPLLKSGYWSSSKLAGFRNEAVWIKNSRHVPPPHTAVLDCMETLFSLLKEEENPAVRAVLGHFIFVYIHPYSDGNGRLGRFIMNLMLISGGYNWNIIRVESRKNYMEALEEASVKGNISKFAEFVTSEMAYWDQRLKQIE